VAVNNAGTEGADGAHHERRREKGGRPRNRCGALTDEYAGCRGGMIPDIRTYWLGGKRAEGHGKPMRTRSIRCLLGILAIVLPACGAAAQEPVLQTCLDAAADFSPVYPTSAFPSGTKEITAVWQLGEGERYQELVGTFIAVDVGAAAPANYHIFDARVELGNSRAGRFRFAQPGPLPAGHYQLAVTGDGKPWKSVDFVIEPNRQNPPVQRLEDLIPLRAGKVWRYDFTQEAGEGAQVSLPDIEPGADGKLHAIATYTVAGTDDAGAHIEMRRDARLVLEEWWRLGPGGLAVTQRRADNQLVPLEPPQLMLPWPPGIKTWDWPAKDAADHEHFMMWGPLPIDSAAGQVPGYVVLTRTEQPNSLVSTIERQFASGIGMVREHTVVQLGPVTAVRQDVVLSASEP
jgi:hypothetical protein